MKRIKRLLYILKEKTIKKEKDVVNCGPHLSKKTAFSIPGGNIRTSKLYQIIEHIKTYTFLFLTSILLLPNNVCAVDKIDGGDVTIEKLGTIIKGLATKIQIFGVIVAFVATLVFTVQYIIGDDEAKQRKKKTIIYTLAGVGVLILIPSIINFIIDMLG